MLEMTIIIELASQASDIKWNKYLGDNCIVFENFTASIGDLMVAN
jgi:hypothetical protein